MRYLLDVSIIIPLLLDYGEKLIDIASKVDFYITDLSVYEVGNSLWKLVVFVKTIKPEEASDIAQVFRLLIRRGVFKVVRFENIDLQKIFQLAIDEELTFYDASYIISSEIVNATLATEDTRLRDKARKYINTMGYRELLEELLRAL